MAVATVALLSSLVLVAWRQSRALEALAELDRVREGRALAEAEKADLERRIEHLESRGRIVREARATLRMRAPQAREIIILSGEAP